MSLLHTLWSTFGPYNMGRRGWTFYPGSKKQISLLWMALLLSFVVVACSDGTTSTPSGGASNNAPQPTPGPVALSALHWCSKPAMVFRDQADPNAAKVAGQTNLGPANGTPTAINDWNTVKSNLGFTTYLPKTLPAGSCLLNVSGSLRDPIFGSNFTITYVLPGQNSISFSQAPSRSQNASFQCNVSDALATNGNGAATKAGTPGTTSTPSAISTPTSNPVQLCNGVREKTNIVFSARGTTSALEQFFQGLQPDVDWMPAN